jgi:hypothetical protein
MSDPISELRGKIRNAVLLMLTVSFALGVGYQLFVPVISVLAVFIMIRLAAAAVRKLRR